ncbi:MULTISPECIES: CBS domain-containing protein [Anaerosinus]|uniref:CBS domain-containing protein n=1 Tax=Selenobaculum gibii TaxID=3054208 RepID=A0A9Y2ESS9_9FIRM|nr:CBS domain-containing protein [Selenobaculum gbiensis]WIW70711.1 CBS domain-containing protein [Selenobaculum gbiensis]
MFVSDIMTKNPVTVSPDLMVDEAALIMNKNRFRRLPVVKDGNVVGFISDRDIMQVAPSPATTLSKYEVNSLLAKIKVKEIMSKKVYTIQANAPIEEAALMMCNNKIGGMPVISSTGAIVGIITETDVFKAVVDIMGLTKANTRLTIQGDDKVGVVQNVSAVFANMGINITSLVSTQTGKKGKFELVVRADIDNVDEIKAKLAEKGYELIHLAKIS